ncbi:MAG: tetratricopeptide repeat protein [Thermomicrobiales bacterium]
MNIPRTIPIPAAIIIVLVTAVGGVLVWTMMRHPEGSPQDSTLTRIPIETVQAVALDDAGRGDIDAALRLYDQQIAARLDGDEKRELLLSKSSWAASSGRSTDAIAAAKQALSISGKDDQEALRALAEAYTASGDTKQALVYYKKMLEGAPQGEAPSARSLQRGPSIESIVKELERSA